MKPLKALILSAWFLLPVFSANGQFVPGASQYHEQALLFSQINYTGSARMQGIGGAQVSLGGDISSALSNPAGLGFYNRSEFTFTPSLNSLNNNSTYIGSQSSDSRAKFNFDNLGVVWNKSKADHQPGAWRGGSFAISYSKVAEYNSNILYNGINPDNDIIDMYVQDANRSLVGSQSNPFGFGTLGFETYMISEFGDVFQGPSGEEVEDFYGRTFFTEFPNEEFPTNQSESIETSGSQNYISFAYGGNVDDRLYFGAGFNISTFNYQQTNIYRELYPTGSIMQRSTFSESLDVYATGVSGSFGLIGRPIDKLTIGISLMTPTLYAVEENYFVSVTANYNNFNMQDYEDYFIDNEEAIMPSNPDPDYLYTFADYDSNVTLRDENYTNDLIYDYTLTTPLRVNGGATYFLGKLGFISADIEYVDYSTMVLQRRGGDAFLSDQNRSIRDFYTNTINYRIGGEARFDKFRARAGFAYYGDPYKRQPGLSQLDRSRKAISLGGGYRNSNFFIDLAATTMFAKSYYSPYSVDVELDPGLVQNHLVQIDHRDLHFRVSVGFFF